ncbi:putative phosphatase [Escherichia coli]|uniref:Putative phosphatase n=1 Tax=Escherichia coli TaxID=562 RepID=A0A485J7C8_ECOLX|nr:putative phosphatase [Escherichia coli]
MAIKLIAIDMDGTLLLPDHTISPAVKNAIAAARARGVNVVLTTGRPYAGVHNYLKELHMEQPGDYCITYNGALVQKAADGSTVAQTALSYDDYRFLEKLSREVGSHFHALDRTTLYTAIVISATTRCMNLSLPPFRWCSAKRRKWTPIPSS